MNNTSELKWVIVDGELHNISEFAHLDAKKRPKAHCPQCGQEIIFKLGEKNVHHIAHKSNSKCELHYEHPHNKESTLHINTKLHLYNYLLNMPEYERILVVDYKCAMCNTIQSFTWVEDWERIEVEHRIDPLIPDIAFIKDGRVIAVIEVYVTHSVSRAKLENYQSEGIRWLEVEASKEMISGDTAWRPKKPLKARYVYPSFSKDNCAGCQKRAKDSFKRIYEDIIITSQTPNNNSIPLPSFHIDNVPYYISSHRFIDLYFNNGNKLRLGYYIVVYNIDDTNQLARLYCENEIIEEVQNATQKTIQTFQFTFKNSIKDLGTIANIAYLDDKVMDNWIRGNNSASIPSKSVYEWPFRKKWDPIERRWEDIVLSQSVSSLAKFINGKPKLTKAELLKTISKTEKQELREVLILLRSKHGNNFKLEILLTFISTITNDNTLQVEIHRFLTILGWIDSDPNWVRITSTGLEIIRSGNF